MSLSNLFDQSLQSLSEFWTARDTRERSMLTLGAGVVVLGLIYALLIDPALTGRDQLNKNLPVLRQQVAQLQALSVEATTFSGRPAPAVSIISRERIESALVGKGIKPLSVTLSGDQTTVQLAAVSFSATLDWLGEMQRTAQLSVVDANIVALAQPDMVNVTLVLRQQRNE